MFSCPDTDTFTLHYGTNPLLGFHLATAYVPLASTSPLRPETLESSPLRKLVEVARIAFRAWANWYRDGHHAESLVLDGEDYDNGTAPLCFNCIDTSNLVDHVGILIC